MNKWSVILFFLLSCWVSLAQSEDECVVYDGLKRDYRPTPVDLPHAVNLSDGSKGEIAVGEIIEKLPEIWTVEAPVNARYDVKGDHTVISRTVRFDFYGVQQIVSVPKEYGSFIPKCISESGVNDFYKELESYEYQLILSDCEKYKALCSFNDWAVLQWMKSLSKAVFQENTNNVRELFTAFILNKMRQDIKIARFADTLFLLFSSQQTIYSRKFINYDTYRYYFLDSVIPTSKISVYRTDSFIPGRPLDMRLRNSISFGEVGNYSIRKLSTEFPDASEVPVNSSRLQFFGEYPQVDLNIYAMAANSEEFSAFLQKSFGSLASKDKVDALNRILRYLQLDFKYKSDLVQFGYEKPFFCEENYVYDCNDCEDRCILMSHIIRNVLDLRTIMLEYSDHIALAVHLNCDIKGDYVRRGNDKYYVCDPTYIGATVGMSIPEYRKQAAKIWAL